MIQAPTQRVADALDHALGQAVRGYLADESVVEVMINPDGAIWIDHIVDGRARTDEWLSPLQVERSLRLLAHIESRVINYESPRISGVLPGMNYRFQGSLPPVTAGPVLVIRKHVRRSISLGDYLDSGLMTQRQLKVIEESLEQRRNIIVAGGTSSGKTTLVNALLGHVAAMADRLIILEDTPELDCAASDQVRLRTSDTAPTISLGDLVRDALRLRPDRIIVGEVRDGSALDLLKAWNTGHPGGIATVHANSAEDALLRLEELTLERASAPPRALIGRTVELIIFVRRTPRGRCVEQLVRVEGWTAGGYRLSDPEESENALRL